MLNKLLTIHYHLYILNHDLLKITYRLLMDDNFTQKLMDLEYFFQENICLLNIIKLALDYGDEVHKAGVVSIVDIMLKKSKKAEYTCETLGFDFCNLIKR